MRVIGRLREKTPLPSGSEAEGFETSGDFSVPIDIRDEKSERIIGRDGRVVRGTLSEDRSEVFVQTKWGRVSFPYVSFSWLLELRDAPAAPAKEKAR